MTKYDTLHDWSIITVMECGKDYLALCGYSELHDKEVHVSTFKEFDAASMMGVSNSGVRRKLGKFIPNGNAATIEEAIAWIMDGVHLIAERDSEQSKK